jgi:membrane protease YdiL (CAAX protease family)
MRRIFPAAPPETSRQRALAARPLRQRLGWALAATGCMLGFLFWADPLLERLSDLAKRRLGAWCDSKLVEETLILALTLVITQALVGLGNVRLRWRGAWVAFVLTLPILLPGFLDLEAPAHSPGWRALVHAMVVCLGIGFAEETWGRGLLLTLLGGKRHLGLAIVGSAVGFGYLHLPGYVALYGWRDALILSTASSAGSAIAAIVALRSGSILGLVLFHAVDDFRTFYSTFGQPDSFQFSSPANPKVMIVLTIIALLYWLACRREILQGSGDGEGDG